MNGLRTVVLATLVAIVGLCIAAAARTSNKHVLPAPCG